MALQNNNNLTSFLNSLLAIYPSDALLLVGAGNGSGSLVEWLIGNKISHVTLVEPQDTAFRQLESLISNLDWIENESWTLSKEVVAKESAQLDFYYANKSSESGLVDLEACKEIWPNLKLNQQVTVQAVGLDTLLSQSSQIFNWLIIDCLGVLQLIGNDSNLKGVDVIVVRVLFDLENNTETYSAYAEINKILDLQGFNEKLKYAGQHPNVGHVVFVRDYKCQSTELVKELNIQKAAYENTASQLKAESQQASELQAKQSADEVAQLQVQIQQLYQQLDVANDLKEQVINQHRAEKDKLLNFQQASELQTKQNAEEVAQLQVQIQQLYQQLDAANNLKEQVINQHRAEKDKLLSFQQASELQTKQNTEEVIQLQEKIQELHQQLDSLNTLHEQVLNEHKTEHEALLALQKASEAYVKFVDELKAKLQVEQKASATEKLKLINVVQLNAQLVVNKQLALQRIRLVQKAQIKSEVTKSKNPFVLKDLVTLDLGNAWAGNTVNTVIFRHHAIFTHGEFQYTAFYVDEKTLRVLQRNITNQEIKVYDLLGEYNLRDAHNSISLGIDRAGYLHLSFDHHATKLRYRRSLMPQSIDGWSEDLPMTGVYEDKVTYPAFILPRASHPLTLLYRDGTHNKGSARIKTYDEKTKSWQDRPTPILAGIEQTPWTSNAYWNHPAIGSDGCLHLSYVWRTGTVGPEERVNNINMGYAWSPDNGYNWFTAHGQPYSLPITPAVAETIWPVPAGSNLINQCSMALDSNDLPHIVFYSNDENDIPQYQHLWLDGKTWKHSYISKRTKPFNLAGAGTLQIPISRPDIVIDKADNVYVIYRGDITHDCMTVTRLLSPDYAYNEKDMTFITNESVGFSEPIIDRTRWQQESLLTLLIQYNAQPDHDVGHALIEHPIQLVDVQFS